MHKSVQTMYPASTRLLWYCVDYSIYYRTFTTCRERLKINTLQQNTCIECAMFYALLLLSQQH